MLRIFSGNDVIYAENNIFSSDLFRLPYMLEPGLWEYTTDLSSANIISVNYNISESDRINTLNKLYEFGFDPKTQYLLLLEIFHVDDFTTEIDTMQEWYANRGVDKTIVVHTNLENKHNGIYYDFLWNRSKAYMTDYGRLINGADLTWTRCSNHSTYSLSPIKKHTNSDSMLLKYLCPNRVYDLNITDERGHKSYPVRGRYRVILKNWLISNDRASYLGYLSDPSNGIIFEPEQAELISVMKLDEQGGGGTWYPIANKYYESSFWSVYVETITKTILHYGATVEIPDHHKVRTITEKTWDPLIKGHFILPFGYSGIIEDIKSYGFLFPDWIDYSYDTVKDDDTRFLRFLESVNKLLTIGVPELETLFHRDKYILEHNRSIFWSRPYDTLADKIETIIGST